ncbi:MAG: cellulase family glycosylhydrolase [Clostridia bacterium]|nr:cellulase family glycosylhydrolase [Clostridia bacterium]
MIWYALAVVAAALVLFAITFYVALTVKNPNPKKKRKQTAVPTGYVRAEGGNIYDENGKILVLKGVNLGNWFVQEPWMAVSTLGKWKNSVYGKKYKNGEYTQKRALEAMRANRYLDEEKISELNRLYIDNYITEKDFGNISSLGLNCVRINFTCYNFTYDGYEIDENAFIKLDEILGLCEKYGLYVILDNHGAIGSQNRDNHSGNNDTFDLYGNEKNENATKRLWRYIAGRYAGKYKNVIAGYDLLNEPRRAPGKFAGKKQFDFYNELYKTIRAEDPERMIIAECFTFPAHGVNGRRYGWENVCYSYHIYNLTPFSERFVVKFYRAMHNLMRYDFPVIISEFSEWSNEKGWRQAFEEFEKLGWSHLCWLYKSNKYYYCRNENKMNCWGLYELDAEPVNLYTADYAEIADKWKNVTTDKCVKSTIYYIYAKRFGGEERDEIR